MPAKTDPGTGESMTPVEGDTLSNDADPTPDQVGYCHQDVCPQFGVEVSLWKNLADVPVLCQCGHLLSPLRPGEDVKPEPVNA